MSEASFPASMLKGDRWRGELGGRMVEWHVIWVGKKKARLHANLGYAWATVTVWIERVLDSPDWERIS